MKSGSASTTSAPKSSRSGDEMQCVILAGGRGDPARTTGADRPKHLVTVAGRPFADLQLDWLAAAGVDNVVYCIGHLGDQIVDHVGDGAFGLRIDYCDEGTDLRGTGGALRLALDEGKLDERFFVLYGDSFLRLDLAEMWARRWRPGRLRQWLSFATTAGSGRATSATSMTGWSATTSAPRTPTPMVCTTSTMA